jgi:hypothetical protein
MDKRPTDTESTQAPARALAADAPRKAARPARKMECSETQSGAPALDGRSARSEPDPESR